MWNNNAVLPVLESIQCPFYLITLVILLNNVVLPIVAPIFVNVNCMLTYFRPPNPVSTDYFIQTITCAAVGPNYRCLKYGSYIIPIHSTISPPFVYSGQCSSAIVAAYVPTYLLMFGITGLLVPMLQCVVILWLQNTKNNKLLLHFKSNIAMYTAISYGVISRLTLPIQQSDLSTLATVIAADNTNAISDDRYIVVRKFYDMHGWSISCVTHVFLLLTFGIGYPILGVVILISLTIQTLVLQFGIRYHYLQIFNNASLYKACNKVLEIETRKLHRLLSSSLKFSIILSSLLVLVFIVDMTWSDQNSNYFLLPLLFMIMVILLLLAIPYWLTLTGRLSVISKRFSNSARYIRSTVEMPSLFSTWKIESTNTKEHVGGSDEVVEAADTDTDNEVTVVNPISASVESMNA